MKFWFRAIMVFGSIVTLSACKKNIDSVETPVAGLMAFNLSTDQPAVNITLSHNLLPGGPLGYTNYTGNYLNVYPGNRIVESFGQTASQRLDSVSYTFEPGKYYSLFVMGANNSYKNVVSADNYDSLTASSGKAYIRYVNALSNAAASQVSVSSGGANLVSDNAEYGKVSEFVAVNPGDISVSVTNEGAVNANRTFSVAQQKAYTILLSGLPNQTDSTKSVQIKFIVNGTVTD
ncbi:MAG: DUF4397 domain-containing protein [Flavisolibacter sp.]